MKMNKLHIRIDPDSYSCALRTVSVERRSSLKYLQNYKPQRLSLSVPSSERTVSLKK